MAEGSWRKVHGYADARLRLLPVAVLTAVALTVFIAIYVLDVFVTGGGVSTGSGLGRFLRFDPDMITDALPALAGMTAAVLGIVITVVSIIVQLSSDRYTGVARMFVRDRVHVVVMAFYVVVCVCGVMLSLSVKRDWVPRAAVAVMMAATAVGLVMMLPYFAYVFRFLEPTNIVDRIRRDALAGLTRGAASQSAERVHAAQAPALTAMEELTDLTSNSISGKDKIIASKAVDGIRDFILQYLIEKPRFHKDWFQLGSQIRGNPDFVAMDPESLAELEQNHTWLEWKALRQYLGIYAEAQTAMPDINYLIAINTRYIAEAAAKGNDDAVIEICYRYMNSYLRAALNARGVRAAYNVLNQYRLMVEAMIRAGKHGYAVEGVRHMIYYGRTSFDMQLGFVTETVAYDVSALCEFAHTVAARQLDEEVLTMFLELDQPLRKRSQESALQGIRKAQLKLACFYLAVGDEPRAERIADDMAGEEPSLLAAIRTQMEKVEAKEFWEIIDRGRNFEYMPARQRNCVPAFFSLLQQRQGEGGKPAP